MKASLRQQARDAREARGQRYVTALERGITTAELAAQDGLKRAAVCMFLKGMGLPSSVIEAARARAQREDEAAAAVGSTKA